MVGYNVPNIDSNNYTLFLIARMTNELCPVSRPIGYWRPDFHTRKSTSSSVRRWKHTFVYTAVTSYWVRWRLKSPASRLLLWNVCSGADHRKHRSSTSLAFVRGIHRWPVNSPHKGTVTRKMFSFDGVIMTTVVHGWVGRVILPNKPETLTGPG